MVTKDNLRLSGIYGKKIMTHFKPFLVREDETMKFYKSGGMTLNYYPKKHKIFIQGRHSEEMYQQLLDKINHYLEELVSLPLDESYVQQLKMLNDKSGSLDSKNHIFNIEILTLLALKKEVEKFDEALSFALNFRYNEEEYYSKLIYFILLEEEIDFIKELCKKIKTSRSEVERYKIWEDFYASMYLDTKEKIEDEIQKIKI